MGIQPAWPDQRTWMILESSGRSFSRKAATVLGAASSS